MKPYCTQNDGDCSTCALVSYGRDCRNKLIAAIALGRMGGASKSPAKQTASRENGRRGGRPRKKK